MVIQAILKNAYQIDCKIEGKTLEAEKDGKDGKLKARPYTC